MGGSSDIDLRAMVREVLREVLADRQTASAHAVRIGNDAELQAFVARLAAPGAIEAVRTGSLKFVFAGADARSGGRASPPAPTVAALDGVISERRLQGMASGTTVKLAAGAVLTPLAKDVARRLGLKLERIGA